MEGIEAAARSRRDGGGVGSFNPRNNGASGRFFFKPRRARIFFESGFSGYERMVRITLTCRLVGRRCRFFLDKCFINGL
ncbi:Uncharacterized protein dnl_56910 [Desulfonema limicola]|uniref:Uncharacterized protein n=1 Tax=Desulfonema limicola TaxID=45656 RepID=A0A975GJZ0_9BACT|nr:Uncharacterized protein dnl_56910 [Desulfonema limicola]